MQRSRRLVLLQPASLGALRHGECSILCAGAVGNAKAAKNPWPRQLLQCFLRFVGLAHRFARGGKCFYMWKHADRCGNMVLNVEPFRDVSILSNTLLAVTRVMREIVRVCELSDCG